ncbi:hypothetical protein GCM10027290_64830 [Micromonospora sonneratiae]|uniref:DUF4375 domain-containing protein n=1 Tax=Micromonospora sonneratiae TaxID=1184706 RepID=A0ABW3YAX1_9ACTN
MQEGAAAVVASNVSVVNAMFDDLLHEDEIAPEALMSYCVDYYYAQVLNGGFAQFVANSGWVEDVNARVGSGLAEMGATRHLEIWDRSVRAFESLTARQRERYAYDYALDGVDEATADVLNSLDDEFYSVDRAAGLTDLNAAWLLQRPNLHQVPRAGLAEYIAGRIARIADLAQRRAAAERAYEENMPDFERGIRALCAELGETLDRITAGDPTFVYEGSSVVAWSFLTDRGHRRFVEVDGRRVALDGNSGTVLAELVG